MNDDDLETRLRRALGSPLERSRVDADDFLTSVHSGARTRRIKRGVGIAAAAALAVTGGGLALNTSGLLDGTPTHVADGLPTKSTVGTPGTLRTHVTPTTPDGTTPARPTAPKRSHVVGPTLGGGGPIQVQISPKRFIAANEVQPLSLTATGSQVQWVLAKTPNRVGECKFKECASLFATRSHGKAWTDVGQLPVPPAASPDAPTPDSVSQVRFTQREGTTYDGWAFGNALWSTHDSGRSWSPSGDWNGSVTALESWGANVYAGVSSGIPGDDTATLYRSPTTTDDWTPVQVNANGLTSIDALATATGVVALIDGGQLHPTVYLSRSGESGDWHKSRPCPAGTSPSALSSAGDAGVGAIWVTCQGLSDAALLVTDTDHLGTWTGVPNDSFPATVAVAAMSPTVAFVAGDKIPGIEMVPTAGAPTVVSPTGATAPVLFGFTNPSTGYLVDRDGTMLSTTDGGATWLPYAVSDTKP
jgi:photosystem II stability/assembly factor-like uncharacterized protein